MSVGFAVAAVCLSAYSDWRAAELTVIKFCISDCGTMCRHTASQLMDTTDTQCRTTTDTIDTRNVGQTMDTTHTRNVGQTMDTTDTRNVGQTMHTTDSQYQTTDTTDTRNVGPTTDTTDRRPFLRVFRV
jgi:hypothetical protein